MILFLLLSANAFEIELGSQETLCLSEELSEDILLVLNVQNLVNLDVLSIFIQNPKSEIIFSKVQASFLKTSFTAQIDGTHTICIHNQAHHPASVDVDIKTGVRAKDYSGLASTKEMREIDYRIKMYEDLIKQIHSRMQVLREREEQMRDTNLTIHSRVIAFSVSTLVLLVALAVIQVLYLKRFFRAKKMI